MGYPTEGQLQTIKEFDLTKKPIRELLDYVEPLWEYGDWGFVRTRHKLELHTGGWSGNEDILEALHHNFLFWSMCWKSSRRGGHYVFNGSMLSKELKGFETLGGKG